MLQEKERNPIAYLFPEYKEIEQAEQKRMLRDTSMAEPFTGKNPQERFIPMFRYIPSRIVMQRIIMRATLLPANFVKFKED